MSARSIRVAGRAWRRGPAEPAAAPAGEDRYIGYYYPKPSSTEHYTSPMQTITGTDRAQRVQFATVVSQGTIQSAYRVPYAVFVKGEKADKMIIVGLQPGELGTVYRMRAILANMTTMSRLSPFFQERTVAEDANFFDLLKLLGFQQITITDGGNFRMLQNPLVAPELKLSRAQLRLTLRKDGTISAFVGGYQSWRDVYLSFAGPGPMQIARSASFRYGASLSAVQMTTSRPFSTPRLASVAMMSSASAPSCMRMGTQNPSKTRRIVCSHSTCVAARELGRRYIGIEIDPTYYATARERLTALQRRPDPGPPAGHRHSIHRRRSGAGQ